MAAPILPRQILHNWRPINGHVPPPGLFEADAGWYRHGMHLQRNAHGVVLSWNPLAAAMDDLEEWVQAVLPRLPQGYVMGAYFDVCGHDGAGNPVERRLPHPRHLFVRIDLDERGGVGWDGVVLVSEEASWFLAGDHILDQIELLDLLRRQIFLRPMNQRLELLAPLLVGAGAGAACGAGAGGHPGRVIDWGVVVRQGYPAAYVLPGLRIPPEARMGSRARLR